MDSRQHGEHYARIFRKAGAYLAKGNVARAVEALKEGRALAERQGHEKMARLFASEIQRARGHAGPALE